MINIRGIFSGFSVARLLRTVCCACALMCAIVTVGDATMAPYRGLQSQPAPTICKTCMDGQEYVTREVGLDSNTSGLYKCAEELCGAGVARCKVTCTKTGQNKGTWTVESVISCIDGYNLIDGKCKRPPCWFNGTVLKENESVVVLDVSGFAWSACGESENCKVTCKNNKLVWTAYDAASSSATSQTQSGTTTTRTTTSSPCSCANHKAGGSCAAAAVIDGVCRPTRCPETVTESGKTYNVYMVRKGQGGAIQYFCHNDTVCLIGSTRYNLSRNTQYALNTWTEDGVQYTDQKCKCKDSTRVLSGTNCVCGGDTPVEHDGQCISRAHKDCIDSNGTWTDNQCDCGDGKEWKDNQCADKEEEPAPEEDSNDSNGGEPNSNNNSVPAVSGGNESTVPSPDPERKSRNTLDGQVASQQRINDAQAKYDAARENEQSLGNRMLGAATMGAMGIGGKMVAQSLAEQAADADAERDMAAYLASFKCEYGGGRTIRGGQTNIELPGGNQLIPLYSQYVALANDLKERKAQLGLKAGIESEKILDSATTGLYDDVGVGITSGAYASLARALQDPNGADAKMWAEQKEKTAQNLKTGAITAGVGAAVGLVGNIISSEVFKNKMKNLKSVTILQQTLDAIPEPTVTQDPDCPSDARGTYPECNCGSNAIYNPNTNKCDRCPGNQTVEDNECGCWTAPRTVKNGDDCVDPKKQCEYECAEPTTENHLVRHSNCTCGCVEGYEYKNKQCEPQTPPESNTFAKVIEDAVKAAAPDASLDIVNTVITTVTKEAALNEAVLKEALFDFGRSTLTAKAKEALDDFAKNLKEIDNVTKCTIEVSGYTDRAGKIAYNQTLSEERATSVKNYLTRALNTHGVTNTMTARGYGETQCFCVAGSLDGWKACNGKKAGDVARGYGYPACRVVKLKAVCEAEQQVATTQ